MGCDVMGCARTGLGLIIWGKDMNINSTHSMDSRWGRKSNEPHIIWAGYFGSISLSLILTLIGAELCVMGWRRQTLPRRSGAQTQTQAGSHSRSRSRSRTHSTVLTSRSRPFNAQHNSSFLDRSIFSIVSYRIVSDHIISYHINSTVPVTLQYQSLLDQSAEHHSKKIKRAPSHKQTRSARDHHRRGRPVPIPI